MEPTICREKLGKLIAEETLALRELSSLLESEHANLNANDVTALEASTRERQRCVARIIRTDDERRSLCRELGHSDDLTGLEAVLRWCDPEGTLLAVWSQCAAAASDCRRRNDRNGALVTARLQHVHARLEVLIESRRHRVTYGPRGAYAAAGAGRVLVTEA